MQSYLRIHTQLFEYNEGKKIMKSAKLGVLVDSWTSAITTRREDWVFI